MYKFTKCDAYYANALREDGGECPIIFKVTENFDFPDIPGYHFYCRMGSIVSAKVSYYVLVALDKNENVLSIDISKEEGILE